MIEKKKRLHKIIANAGIASLREAEKLIEDGAVTVDGEKVTTKGFLASEEKSKIVVNGRLVVPLKRKDLLYIKGYKPKGYITSRKDEKNRKTVMDLLPDQFKSLYPIGRLDYHSEGLIIFTNDGIFAKKLIDPANKIKRVYLVKVRNLPNEKALAKMVTGIKTKTEKLKVQSATIVDKREKNCWLKISLVEGKNRHIRKLLEPLGYPVLKLKRIEFGSVKLGSMKANDIAFISAKELAPFKNIKANKANRK